MLHREKNLRLAGLALAAVLLAGSTALAQEQNVIRNIKTAGSGVEIELESSKEFRQSDLPVLRIGEREFTISRYPDSGEPTRMIFMLDAEGWSKTSTGDAVVFQYGRGDRGRNGGQRDFGRLDKSKLDK